MATRAGRGRGRRLVLAGALAVPVAVGVSVPARAPGLVGTGGRPTAERYLTREQAEAALPARLERLEGREALRRARAAAAGGRVRSAAEDRAAPPHAAPRPPVPPEIEQLER